MSHHQTKKIEANFINATYIAQIPLAHLHKDILY